MKAALICPGDRAEVPLLASEGPLALAPALGRTILEYWMSHLASSGVKEVVVLAHDRPDEIRKMIDNGSRWGVAAEVCGEVQELTPEQASEKYGAAAEVMDHFPGLPEHPLFSTYEGWFKALAAWLPRAKTSDRVGMREVREGVWVGLHGHIARNARLCAPCWVGDHVYVGPGASIGPGTILEDGAFIERETKIENSIIGTATFVGKYVRITHSLAFGDILLNWQTGLQQRVSDAFLLCSVRLRLPSATTLPFLDRVAEWLAPAKTQEPDNYQALLLKKGSAADFAPVRGTQSP